MCNLNMPFRNLCKITATVGVVVSFMIPGQSFAELWQLTPRITLEEIYDDNIRLLTGPHDSVTGTLLKGYFGVSRLTENSGVVGRLYLDLSDYSGDEEVTDNNNNVHISLDSHRKTERTKWGLKGVFRRDTTLRRIDVLEDSDDAPVDIEDDVDEGLVTTDIRRHRLNLRPSLQHSISERTELSMSYNYQDVRYEDNPAGSGLFDYFQHSVNAGFFRRLTERDTINFSLGVGRFESEDNADNQVDTYALTVGFKRALSETTNGTIKVGINHSEQKSNVQDSESDGYILRLGLNHKTEVTRYNALLSHDLKPSGAGNIIEATEFNLRIRHRFSERLGGALNLGYTERETIGSSPSNTRRYYSIRPRLNWKLSRWWTVGGGYNYRQSKADGSVDSADSNAVYISLSHSKPITLD